MGVSVVMPALEMAQETGKLVSWLKKEGEHVRKGDMLLEVETDKAVVEIEAAGDGILGGVTAKPGDVIQVGHTDRLAAAARRISSRARLPPPHPLERSLHQPHRPARRPQVPRPPQVVHASHPRPGNSRRSMALISRA